MTINYYLKGRQENVLKTCKKILDNEIMVEMVERIKEISTQGEDDSQIFTIHMTSPFKTKIQIFFCLFP